MATLQSITKLLKEIEENIAFLTSQETELNGQIELLSRENDKLKTYLKPEQPSLPETSLEKLPSYNPPQSPLSSIAETCTIVIERNKILLSNREKLSKLYRLLKTMVPEISIKKYIMECNNENIKNCYDSIDRKLQDILHIVNIQEGQLTIFQKGYLLYDLMHDNTMEEFIELLRDTSKTYNTVIHNPRPQPQSGGAPSTLLQVIGLTKIKAIIKFMNSATNLDISDVTNANTLIGMEDVINAIAEFFYKQPIMLQQPYKN
jgi:hypothetical protein